MIGRVKTSDRGVSRGLPARIGGFDLSPTSAPPRDRHHDGCHPDVVRDSRVCRLLHPGMGGHPGSQNRGQRQLYRGHLESATHPERSDAQRLQRDEGFKIATIDNDPLGKTILGVGEIRHGPSGLEGAILAAQRLPGATLVQDSRMDASVDIVMGQAFSALTVPARVASSTKAKPATPHC